MLINSICPVLKSRISSVKSEIYADCQRNINSLLRRRDAIVSESEAALFERLNSLERHASTLRTRADISFWLPDRPSSIATSMYTPSKKPGALKDVQVGSTRYETDHQRKSVRTHRSECGSFSTCSSLVDKVDAESFEVLGASPRSSDWLWPKINLADFARSAEAPLALCSSDCSLWLARKAASSIAKTCPSRGTSLMPPSLRSKSTCVWLHKPKLVAEVPQPHDELTAKLVLLAERTTADEDKEVDHSELVAMVCCNGSGSATCIDGGCKPCKSFSECRRTVGDVSSCAARLAKAAKPLLSQWLAREAVLPPALQKDFKTPPTATIPPYLREMRAIAASDSAHWLAAPSMEVNADNTSWERRWLVRAPQAKTSEGVIEVPTEDSDEEADVEEETENPEYLAAATTKAKLAHILSEEMSPEAMLEMIPAYPHHHASLSRWLNPKCEAP
ncbi:hypothetical protein SprV_0802510600 [Sparganum proliferum]